MRKLHELLPDFSDSSIRVRQKSAKSFLPKIISYIHWLFRAFQVIQIQYDIVFFDFYFSNTFAVKVCLNVGFLVLAIAKSLLVYSQDLNEG